jgi:acetylglutamate/LysW-gamma-L-alpha-aminoadipate kinase
VEKLSNARKTLTVKIGGSILRKGFPEAFKSDLREVQSKYDVVLIHGGAAIVNELAEKMGKPPRFIVSPGGMKSRYTDKETMEIYTMVMAGKLNKLLVASLQEVGIKAVGISGADNQLLKAVRKERLRIIDERGRKVIIDGGYTGKIETVNIELLQSLFKLGCIPVVSPIAIDDKYQLLNVDSDRAAASIAGNLKADWLILCTDMEGVLINNSVVRELSLAEAKEKLDEIGHGMKRKVYAAMETLEQGTRNVVITSGLGEKPITSAIEHKVGTTIVE